MFRICLQDIADYANQDEPNRIKSLIDFEGFNSETIDIFKKMVERKYIKLSSEFKNSRPHNEMTEQFAMLKWLYVGGFEHTMLILQWLSQNASFVHQKGAINICRELCKIILNDSITYYDSSKYLELATLIHDYLNTNKSSDEEITILKDKIVKAYEDQDDQDVSQESNVLCFCLGLKPWAAYTFYRNDLSPNRGIFTMDSPLMEELPNKLEELLR